MSDAPKFREKYRYSNKPEPCSIEDVVEAEISAAGRMTERGAFEEVQARQAKIGEILAFLAGQLPVDKQAVLAEKLLWELDDGRKPLPGGLPNRIRKPPSGEKGSW